MPKLEVLIGMIASGKSTYARKRADEGALVVCHDDLTEMLHARYRYEPGKRGLYRTMMADLAYAAMADGHDVIADRTHLTRESRQMWVNAALTFAKVCHIKPRLVAVVFPMREPREHAYDRHEADARGRPYAEWLKVARHHYQQAQEEPLDWRAEGFDEMIEIPPR